MELNEEVLSEINIAENLDQETLDKLGEALVTLVEEDESSRRQWLDSQSEWLKLAAQLMEPKNTPWEGAANIKYPLLTTASIQFHARAYGALVQEPNLVNIRIYGRDPQGTKASRAYRTSRYMNYQFLEEMEDWTEGMDRMLFVLPIVGMAYKKTYWSALRQHVSSDLISARDVILNYHARTFETARKTHRMWLTENQVEEYKRKKVFRNVDLTQAAFKTQEPIQDEILGMHASGGMAVEYDMPREIYEVHWTWDLDEDGYREPWIFTVDRDSRTVLRITPRFEWADVELDEKDTVIQITAKEQFTAYTFIPDPNSPLYGIGFGVLLGPMNAAINTTINQLLDAGTLANMPSGFLGRGLNLRGGTIKLAPGEWRMIQNTGEDLKKEILPIPINPPAITLFNLLGMLVQSGEKLASVSDIMVGESPGQNQPYATTAAVLEQGLKVFVGIYKRIYRALTKEYKKVFALNSEFLDEEHYFRVIDTGEDTSVGKQDFALADCDIRPVGDPNVVTDAQRLMKAQMLLEKVQMGFPLNKIEVLKRVLEAEGHQDFELLIDTNPPPPPPEIALKMQELEHKREVDYFDMQIESIRIEFEAMKDKAQAISLLAKADATTSQIELQAVDSILKAMDGEEKAAMEKLKLLADMVAQRRDEIMEEKRMTHEKEMGVQNAKQDGSNSTSSASRQSSGKSSSTNKGSKS